MNKEQLKKEVPTREWPYAITYAAHILNRMPVAKGLPAIIREDAARNGRTWTCSGRGRCSIGRPATKTVAALGSGGLGSDAERGPHRSRWRGTHEYVLKIAKGSP